MKRRYYIILVIGCLAGAVLLGACSRKGAQMPTHRKRRHCNCPTFSYAPQPTPYFVTEEETFSET